MRLKACNPRHHKNETFMMSMIEDVMSCLEETTSPVKMLMIITNSILTGHIPPSRKKSLKEYESMEATKKCILRKKDLVILKYDIKTKFLIFFVSTN